MNKLLKSAFSLALALTLMFSLGTAAFADDYDISKGSIEVNAKDDGVQYVTQTANSITNRPDNTPVITGTSDENTVTITAAAGQDANVTLSGVKIYNYDETAAVAVSGEGTVNIELDGTNYLRGGSGYAGLEKGEKGTLNINDSNGDGTLYAGGGYQGAAIGGGVNKSSANININSGTVYTQGNSGGSGIGGGRGGNGTNISVTGGKVEAYGEDGGSGIGGGKDGYGKNISITGGDVKAIGDGNDWSDGVINGGSGIGGGAGGNAENINISDAKVYAVGDYGAAGIGGGAYTKSENGTTVSKSGTCTNVTISGNADVTAIAGDGLNIGAGTAIGCGADGKKPGVAVTPDTSKLTPAGKVVLGNGYKSDNGSESFTPVGDPIVGTYTGSESSSSLSSASATAAAPLSARYSVIIGKNQTWLAGSDDGLEFTLNSENVVKVLIDGEEVDFELNENGDIVISAEVLQALEAGEHEIEFVFADGSCKTVFTVK